MAIRRTSKFGFPPPTPPSSQYTARMVPLSQGVKLDIAWPLVPPGSTTSMTNYLPLDGKLVPRSRLSSTGTVKVMAAVHGMTEAVPDGTGATRLWVSGTTKHGMWGYLATGRVSLASFTSLGGFGVVPTGQESWDYAQGIFFGQPDLVMAGKSSHDTLQIMGEETVGELRHYYLPEAPRARCVGDYDNYIIAANIAEGASTYNTRVQWCVRGSGEDWTGEGSGFEDLLDMRGRITKIKAFGTKFVLFSEFEIWEGLSATYPAQFQFYPLDESVGCPFPHTIQETDEGLLFLGTDLALRLLPRAGGTSRAVAPQMAEALRYIAQPTETMAHGTFAVYHPLTKLYHLFYEPASGGTRRALVVNTVTSEIGFMDYADPPQCGIAATRLYASDRAEGMFFGGSNGTVFSTSSLLASDSGSAVTSTWRSGVIAGDLPGNWKQLTEVWTDHRSTSTATLTLKVAGDGNTFDPGRTVMLKVAPDGGRAQAQMYTGGGIPKIELTSTSTGYELHRLDVTMSVGGRA